MASFSVGNATPLSSPRTNQVNCCPRVMLNQRWRPVVITAVSVIVLWVLALTGYVIAKNSRVTAEKVRAYAESVELSKLSAADRAKALKKLADMLNALSLEERRQARLDRIPWLWFKEMTEDEKAAF